MPKHEEFIREKKCEGHCPKCKASNIIYEGFEIQDNSGYYEATCQECGTFFKEWHELKYSTSTYAPEIEELIEE